MITAIGIRRTRRGWPSISRSGGGSCRKIIKGRNGRRHGIGRSKTEPEAVDLVKEAMECAGGQKIRKVQITIGNAVISIRRDHAGKIKYKRAVSLEDPASNAE